MAYQFPMYQPNFPNYQPYYTQFQQPQGNAQQSPPQIQNGGFVSVQTIEEAYNWPVAPGNSLTFKIENAPYVCTKTKGFSQLDQPVFEKYRLVKEEDTTPEEPGAKPAEYALKKDLQAVSEENQAIKAKIEQLKVDIEQFKTEISAKKEVLSD